MTQQISIPFGRESVRFTPPSWLDVRIATSNPARVVPDAAAAAWEAIAHPLGSPTIEELARGARSFCIAVTDATRNCPDHLLLAPVLAGLESAGVSRDAITILVAVGTHRASTTAEKREKLGSDIVDRYLVVDHNGSDPAELRETRHSVDGVAVRLNRRVLESDLVIATGRVEPHQYAGFSGGGKTIAIGCAGEEIITRTHGPAMLDRPGVRLGRLEGNPFQDVVRAVAREAKVRFVANCVLDDDDRMVAVAYGDPIAVQDHLAEIARPIYTTTIPDQVDIAIAGVGYPKDQNAYQASRAASYLQYAPIPVVRQGGAIIIPAACPEGAGAGVGEQRFLAAMTGLGGPAGFLERTTAENFEPGQQRAYIMASILRDVTVIFAGVEEVGELESMGFRTAQSIEAAIEMAGEVAGRPAAGLVVPHALLTLPVIDRRDEGCQRVIDLHLHLLPAIDDGSESLAETGAMLREASRLGFTRLVATPHLQGAPDPAFTMRIERALHATRELAAPLRIRVDTGFEVMLSPALPDLVERGADVTLAGSLAILVEAPFGYWPAFADQVLFDLQALGYRPVLAHPERYSAFLDRPQMASSLAEKGIVLQVTFAALTGVYGRGCAKLATRIVEQGLAGILATDAHSPGARLQAVEDGLRIAERLVGRGRVEQLSTGNPVALLENQPLPPTSAPGTEDQLSFLDRVRRVPGRRDA